MVDGLLCVLLELLAEHGLLLRQPVETDVCIIVSKFLLLLLATWTCILSVFIFMRSEAYEQLVQYKLGTNNVFVAFFVVMCKNFSYQPRMCWSCAQSQIYLYVRTILHTSTKRR